MATPSVRLEGEEVRLAREAVEFYLSRVNFSTGDEDEPKYRALLDTLSITKQP